MPKVTREMILEILGAIQQTVTAHFPGMGCITIVFPRDAPGAGLCAANVGEKALKQNLKNILEGMGDPDNVHILDLTNDGGTVH